MFLFPLIIIILAIWLIVYLSTTIASNSHAHTNYKETNYTPHMNRPLEILKERYARGEISEEEYWRIKKNLESNDGKG
ncbi:SHOCT domain-containing protein [Thermotalea metallivorans]|uniref:SHOCT domain-containing protein n=1 Tax=Thermotalea metallivorans TaxID=520762 RepID=A0A140L3B7_9FIRM|nr:SHOCT domain-containing protein [Thermotalea metallivorans]KXG75042.1 hypothetical protein AN619_20120 [Thermotalea metallivorans]